MNGDILSTLRGLLEQASAKVSEYSGTVESIKALIVQHFGQNGLYAAYIVLTVLALFIVWKLLQIAFAAVKYLVIPSIILAFLGSLFVPYSFTSLLPVTVTACSLFLLFRG